MKGPEDENWHERVTAAVKVSVSPDGGLRNGVQRGRMTIDGDHST